MALDPEKTPHDRRAMFRLGFKRILEPVAEYIEQRLPGEVPVPRVVLRPPGALPELEFLDRCYRCGNCVDVCPAKAIQATPPGDVERVGTPFIDPNTAACVVCDDLSCMRSCPSGALQLVESPRHIRMGIARVNHSLCVRSRGENCTLCIDRCPIGADAIELSDGGEIAVKVDGCVGCGVCQFYCPTYPKAIEIDPLQ